MDKGISRRSFLTGAGVLGAAAAASMAGCAPKSLAETSAAPENSKFNSDGTPTFLNTPDPIDPSLITETLEADVCVVGLGVAGSCATRSAAENGLKVIAVERCAQPSAHSGQFAAFNSEAARKMGLEEISTTELVNEMMIQTGHRADARVLKNWADHAGEAFDWYISAYDGLKWNTDGADIDPDKDVYVNMSNKFRSYNPETDHEHVVVGTLSLLAPERAGHQPIMFANVDAAVATGNAETYFNKRARQLVKTDDRVTGVIVEDILEGTYTQINASKGVVLATGGYVRNDDLIAYYLPWIHAQKDLFSFTYPHTDANGDWTDQGDGMLMGHWAGGYIEDGPHCAMAHGDLGKLGVDAFLQLNNLGERYINEDLTNDHFASAILRQPDACVFQIFDAGWVEQVEKMQPGLGTVNKAKPEMIETVNEWTTAHGDTIEEMIANLEVDDEVAATMKREIERYNELCEKGVDEDFGKSVAFMFALKNPPFYAIRYQLTGGPSTENANAVRCLVTMSGLSSNKNAQVLDKQHHVVPGLYAIGNTQGGRYLGDYPATLAGASHSIALTYGYLVGKVLAEQ